MAGGLSSQELRRRAGWRLPPRDPDPECSNRVIRGYAWSALWTTPNTTPDRRKRALLRQFAMDRQAHPPQRTTSTVGVRVASTLFDSREL